MSKSESTLYIQAAQLARIREIAEGSHPHECCGVLGGRLSNGRKEVLEVIPALNERSDSPRNRYLIAPDFHRRTDADLKGQGLEILGFFHSHPDCPAIPSEFDRDHAWPWYSYAIVSVDKEESREFLSWVLKDDRSGFDSEAVEIEERIQQGGQEGRGGRKERFEKAIQR